MKFTVSSPEYWNDRYSKKNDIWTLNSPNPVLVQIIEQRMLVPPGSLMVAGCGKGEDAVFLSKAGFDVTAIDFSAEAVSIASELGKIEGSNAVFLQNDLFKLKPEFSGRFDYIYEYVTFCAIDPEKIEEMIDNIASALKPRGLFVTIPFPVDSREGGPPFAIDLIGFSALAGKYLKLEYFSKNINSVKPRKGNEVLMIFRKGK